MRQMMALHFSPMQLTDIEAVMRIEQTAYTHPWTRKHFVDVLEAGYQAQWMWQEQAQDEPHCLGYYVAMQGVDEVHLLNLTVTPAMQGQGWASHLLTHLHHWARSVGAGWMWLEVRISNQHAIRLYQRHGYSVVGQRKNYYPSGQTEREDAVVMSLEL
jgi:ribosomal-protein-alanine N-acetyltransferase